MNTYPPAKAELICHSKPPGAKPHKIQAGVLRCEDGAIKLSYLIEGELSQLSLPQPSAPEWRLGLWEHSCFEAFIRPGNGQAYWEYNFSPSGAWAALSFRSYRNGKAFGEALQPVIATRRTETRLELDAVLSPELLPGISAGMPLHVGCCAVIEDKDGTLSYWAFRHPAAVPDFHHPDGFALEL